MDKHRNNVSDDHKEKAFLEEDWKQGLPRKTSPNFDKINSIIDRTSATTNLAETEPYIMKLSKD